MEFDSIYKDLLELNYNNNEQGVMESIPLIPTEIFKILNITKEESEKGEFKSIIEKIIKCDEEKIKRRMQYCKKLKDYKDGFPQKSIIYYNKHFNESLNYKSNSFLSSKMIMAVALFFIVRGKIMQTKSVLTDFMVNQFDVKKLEEIIKAFLELVEDFKEPRLHKVSQAELNFCENKEDEMNLYLKAEELNKNLKKQNNYKELYKDGVISWHSDDYPYDVSDVVLIYKKDEDIVLEFSRNKVDKIGSKNIISIRFRNSRSYYQPFNCFLWICIIN